MSDAGSFPTWRQVVLDTTDARGLAEFYRQLLGFAYRPGDEPPEPGCDDERGRDWLVLRPPSGLPGIAFQQVSSMPATTWPEPEIPQQSHLDLTVPSRAEFDRQHDRAIGLGARLRFDRSADADEPLRVYSDPSGHLFCIFVAAAPLPACGVSRSPGSRLRRAALLAACARPGVRWSSGLSLTGQSQPRPFEMMNVSI